MDRRRLLPRLTQFQRLARLYQLTPLCLLAPLHLLAPLRLLAVLGLLTACGGDDYHYPSVQLAYLSAATGSDGSLQQIVTDQGESYPVVSDRSNLRSTPDSLLRIVSNYLLTTDERGVKGAELYAVRQAIAPIPQPAEAFKQGLHTDPAEILSIWMGHDYLNLIALIKVQSKGHRLHFIEQSNRIEGTGSDEVTRGGLNTRSEGAIGEGTRIVEILLYHDADGDVPAYSQRAYLSVPLRHYFTDEVQTLQLTFSAIDESGETKSHTFTLKR